MFSTVTGELGQKIGISGLGKFWYLGKYRLLELRRDGSGMVGNRSMAAARTGLPATRRRASLSALT